MSRVAYSSPYVPAEWIAAHGFDPVFVVPPGTGLTPAAGVCPFAEAFMEAVARDERIEAVVAATSCDQQRRIAELFSRDRGTRLFLMNMPATWETPVARRLYASEIARLGRFLVRHGGRAPSDADVASVMRRYDTERSRLRALRGTVSARAFAIALRAFQETGSVPRSAENGSPSGVPLALVGGPLLEGDLALFEVIERAGGEVVLDATENGERSLVPPFDRRALANDPRQELIAAYFDGIHDVFRRPNAGLYRYLRQHLEERGVRGILCVRSPWCDLWHAEARRIRDWQSRPVLEIDVIGDDSAAHSLTTRIEAFLETVR
jgi:benzoyl-CoA reductase/2-hydroxyglutaryl-CoA dehydratase subunit BcrC/BadD/HgdB